MRSPALAPALLGAALCAGVSAPAWSQSHGHHGHGGNDRRELAADEHAGHERNAEHRHDRQQSPAEPRDRSGDPHADHHHHAGSAQQPREPIPELTDADREAAFPVLQRHMEHAPELNFRVLFERFEWQDADAGSAFAWENKTWIGGDLDRLWIRSEGERTSGRTHAADIELLYGRSVAPWWDVVGGIRHEFRPGPSRSWAAIGVQGLAPYWFEVGATAYLGESGRTAASLKAEYELLLTNRLILQPLLELELHGKDDPARGIGSGLSKAELGLRLRYEVSRRFAPYVGIVRERAYGRTAELQRQAGGHEGDTRVVAGIRWWF